MKPITVVFFGKSGSGKGTQAELLIKKLQAVDPNTKALYVETGQRFRDFVGKSGTYTASRVKEIMSNGKLIPAFLPIWNWTSFLIDNVAESEHMIFDGLCRRPEEAPIFDSALQFYGREKAAIIHLDVHHEEVTRRLVKRGRHDDHPEKITERLKWYETDVMPSVEYFKNNPYYRFLEINGDQSIDKVHEDIVKALGI